MHLMSFPTCLSGASPCFVYVQDARVQVFDHVLLVDICPAEIIYTNLLLCHLKKFRRGVRSLYVLDKLLFLAVITVDWCSAEGNSFSKLEECLELKEKKKKKKEKLAVRSL